jgi:hypothetical protein
MSAPSHRGGYGGSHHQSQHEGGAFGGAVGRDYNRGYENSGRGGQRYPAADPSDQAMAAPGCIALFSSHSHADPSRPRLQLTPRTTDPAALEERKKREEEEEKQRQAKIFGQAKAGQKNADA